MRTRHHARPEVEERACERQRGVLVDQRVGKRAPAGVVAVVGIGAGPDENVGQLGRGFRPGGQEVAGEGERRVALCVSRVHRQLLAGECEPHQLRQLGSPARPGRSEQEVERPAACCRLGLRLGRLPVVVEPMVQQGSGGYPNTALVCITRVSRRNAGIYLYSQ